VVGTIYNLISCVLAKNSMDPNEMNEDVVDTTSDSTGESDSLGDNEDDQPATTSKRKKRSHSMPPTDLQTSPSSTSTKRKKPNSAENLSRDILYNGPARPTRPARPRPGHIGLELINRPTRRRPQKGSFIRFPIRRKVKGERPKRSGSPLAIAGTSKDSHWDESNGAETPVCLVPVVQEGCDGSQPSPSEDIQGAGLPELVEAVPVPTGDTNEEGEQLEIPDTQATSQQPSSYCLIL
jgi:hypothetical protein